jgi:hypothetical protein
MICGISRTIHAETDLIVPSRILEKSASFLSARWARPEVRSSGFEVQKTSNFGPRTLARLAIPAGLACLARRPCGELYWLELSAELTKDLR